MANKHDVEPALQTEVCIAGAGPAGLTLAVLLARAGRQVTVLEQHSGFARPFRGESMSPDSIWLLRRHGLLGALDEDPLEVRRMHLHDAGRRLLSVEFSDFRYPVRFPVEIPQETLLHTLNDVASTLPNVRVIHGARVLELETTADGAVLTARTPGGPLRVQASVVVGADGRNSRVRKLAAIPFTKRPLGRDVLWFKVPRPADWNHGEYSVHIDGDHHAIVLPTNPDLLRVGFNIPKGGIRQLKEAGIEALHERIEQLVPGLGPSVREHIGWGDTSVLDIYTTHAPSWHSGRVVLIGDAAHTLTPVLGVGVNHAVADAVALAEPLAAAVADGAGVDQLSAMFSAFQGGREPDVERARRLQMRQERAFEMSGRAAIRMRRTLYRLIDRRPSLKLWIWRGIYCPIQHAAGA